MTCCILALLLLLGPRFVLLMLWIFNNAYLSTIYNNFFVPCLGFLFLPWTTLGYAFAAHTFPGVQFAGLDSTGILVVIGALVIDILAYSGGGYGGRKRFGS
jgi:hypothetical protein